MTNSIEEIGNAACIFAIGTNTTENHPVIALEIKNAQRKGSKLIVANPREIELCRNADIWLRHRPGSDVALMMGMARIIVDEELQDKEFIDKRCENFDAFKDSLVDFDLSRVTGLTGVSKDDIKRAARMYAKNSPATLLYAMGITQHSHGTDNVLGTANLAMLTGNVGKPSSGVNPLRGQNNVQGACDLGALPNVYTGYQPVADETVRHKFEAAWDCTLPSKPGLVLTAMFPAIDNGTLKALYLLGENPVLSDPDAKHVKKSLARLDFFVVQDIFLTETAQMADVVLPGACFAEQDGTVTNTERRVQFSSKAVEPIGSARPDWQIICEIAKNMGAAGFDFPGAAKVFEEIARVTPSYGGITYERLKNKGSLQWPCPTKNHPGVKFLYADKFARGKGKFVPLEYRPPAEETDKKYPLILTTGRSLYHYHTGTMTRKSKGLNGLRSEELLEINPLDAKNLSIEDGEMVEVSSRRGRIKAKAKVTEISPEGVVFMTFHFKESPTNLLTSPALDPVAKIPELKVCAVSVKKTVQTDL